MPFDATDYREVRLLDRDPRSLTDPRERLEYLRDFLRERMPEGKFNMGDSGMPGEQGEPWCGTAGCFYGWTIQLFGSAFSPHDEYGAAAALGLPSKEAGHGGLFFPRDILRDGKGAIHLRDPQRGANVLDHLLKTGEVDWSVA